MKEVTVNLRAHTEDFIRDIRAAKAEVSELGLLVRMHAAERKLQWHCYWAGMAFLGLCCYFGAQRDWLFWPALLASGYYQFRAVYPRGWRK